MTQDHNNRIPTTLSMPRMKSIMKNKNPQICGRGINEIAWGYVTKAKPAPDVATVATGIPDLSENKQEGFINFS